VTTPAVTADTITRASDRLREAARLLSAASHDMAGLEDFRAAADLMRQAREAAESAQELGDRRRPLPPLGSPKWSGLPADLPQRPVHPAQVAQAALDPDALPDGGVK
jgi:hypothetical protein